MTTDGHEKMSARARNLCHRLSRRPPRPGFTLIEVMVVLALTLVMMTMFATIFSMTGTFVTKQKAVGENDQSARMLTTVLKTDLQARTMRFLAPFHPNANGFSDWAARQGYFYVSENDPLNDADDVLQFTVALQNNSAFSATPNPAAGTQVYATATFLPAPWQPATLYATGALVRPSSAQKNTNGFVFKNKGAPFTSGLATAEPNWGGATAPGNPVTDGLGTWTTLTSPIDQPDGDDGAIFYDNPPAPNPPNRTLDPASSNPNNTGASPYAEVGYFLRHGNLYRRVLLIRQPYDNSGAGTAHSAQPYDTDTPTPGLLIPGVYPPYPMLPNPAGSGNFWTDFDYSARIQPFTDPLAWSLTAPAVALNQLVLPDTPNGFIFTCTAAGTKGATEPVWPTTAGNTVLDGSVTWTATAPPAAPTGVSFLGSSSGTVTLENSLDNSGGATIPIGRPDNRFGFDQIFSTAAAPPAQNGAPREFDSSAAFFGRYTEEETSSDTTNLTNSAFFFPGSLPALGSPMGATTPLTLDPAAFTMSLGSPATLSFAGGPRRGEDILLTNVISFDVKLWDPHYSETTGTGDVNHNGVIDSGPAFADVGHTAATGDFLQSKNIFSVYGPQSATATAYTVPAAGSNSWVTPAFTRTFNGTIHNVNNVFDTWYPKFKFDNFPRAYDTFDPPATPVGGTDLYAPAPYRPRLGNQWVAGTAYTVGQVVDPVNTANGYTYVCTAAGTSQTAAQLAANLPGNVDPFSLSDPIGGTIQSGIPPGTDGTVQWKAQPGVAVQAIQITVKYLDPSQNVLRQVTIVQSLTQ
jgi:prepilin-type N-terminal cleavage/methylation domain-containing protein